ncbi:Uncharacterised protein [uncultured archaeon]|nr:Uncharacterised protein [uncultured archaeon]
MPKATQFLAEEGTPGVVRMFVFQVKSDGQEEIILNSLKDLNGQPVTNMAAFNDAKKRVLGLIEKTRGELRYSGLSHDYLDESYSMFVEFDKRTASMSAADILENKNGVTNFLRSSINSMAQFNDVKYKFKEKKGDRVLYHNYVPLDQDVEKNPALAQVYEKNQYGQWESKKYIDLRPLGIQLGFDKDPQSEGLLEFVMQFLPVVGTVMQAADIHSKDLIGIKVRSGEIWLVSASGLADILTVLTSGTRLAAQVGYGVNEADRYSVYAKLYNSKVNKLVKGEVVDAFEKLSAREGMEDEFRALFKAGSKEVTLTASQYEDLISKGIINKSEYLDKEVFKISKKGYNPKSVKSLVYVREDGYLVEQTGKGFIPNKNVVRACDDMLDLGKAKLPPEKVMPNTTHANGNKMLLVDSKEYFDGNYGAELKLSKDAEKVLKQVDYIMIEDNCILYPKVSDNKTLLLVKTKADVKDFIKAYSLERNKEAVRTFMAGQSELSKTNAYLKEIANKYKNLVKNFKEEWKTGTELYSPEVKAKILGPWMGKLAEKSKFVDRTYDVVSKLIGGTTGAVFGTGEVSPTALSIIAKGFGVASYPFVWGPMLSMLRGNAIFATIGLTAKIVEDIEGRPDRLTEHKYTLKEWDTYSTSLSVGKPTVKLAIDEIEKYIGDLSKLTGKKREEVAKKFIENLGTCVPPWIKDKEEALLTLLSLMGEEIEEANKGPDKQAVEQNRKQVISKWLNLDIQLVPQKSIGEWLKDNAAVITSQLGEEKKAKIESAMGVILSMNDAGVLGFIEGSAGRDAGKIAELVYEKVKDEQTITEDVIRGKFSDQTSGKTYDPNATVKQDTSKLKDVKITKTESKDAVLNRDWWTGNQAALNKKQEYVVTLVNSILKLDEKTMPLKKKNEFLDNVGAYMQSQNMGLSQDNVVKALKNNARLKGSNDNPKMNIDMETLLKAFNIKDVKVTASLSIPPRLFA